MKKTDFKRISIIALVLVCVFVIIGMLMPGSLFGYSTEPDAPVEGIQDDRPEEPPVSLPSFDEPEDEDDAEPPPDTDADDEDDETAHLPEFDAEPEPPEATYLISPPVNIIIPALALDYDIRPMGADRRGNMEVAPFLAVVSWFNRSPIPGNNGNAILAGHNAWGGERSRLFTLDTLSIGDYMEIEYADGSVLNFRLESVFVYPLLTAPAHLIMDTGGQARVTLITCKGPFSRTMGTSENRIVAIFKEESVFVIPVPPIQPYPLIGEAPAGRIPPYYMFWSIVTAE